MGISTNAKTGRHGMKSSGWSLLLGFSGVMVTIVFFELDVKFILRTIVLCLLTLGLCTYALYLCGQELEVFWKWILPKQEEQTRIGSELSEEEQICQQKLVRERSQEEYLTKAAKYEAEVAVPKREAKRARLEKEIQRFSGPAWKGSAHRLGNGPDVDKESEEPSSSAKKSLPRRRVQGTSKDASDLRRLPESVTRRAPGQTDKPAKAAKAAKPEKRVIVLPEEPDPSRKECVTVAMRTLQSTIKRRRFLYTETVQVLVDWMASLGYHPKLYTVCTPFPRRDLSQHVAQTLEEVQIVRDVVVVIEEKDR